MGCPFLIDEKEKGRDPPSAVGGLEGKKYRTRMELRICEVDKGAGAAKARGASHRPGE